MKPLYIFAFLSFLTLPNTLTAQVVRPISIDQLRARIHNGGDTTYVVNFWATWCAPCLKELPHFEKLKTDLKDKKVKVLMVSVDRRSKLKQAVIPMARRLKLTDDIFLLDEEDPDKGMKSLVGTWSGALPATLIVNSRQEFFFQQEFTYESLFEETRRIMQLPAR